LPRRQWDIRIDEDVLWDTVTGNLPALLPLLRDLLDA